MGLWLWSSIIVFALLIHHITCQEPNTDGFYLSDMFRNMGLQDSTQLPVFSSSLCSWRGVVCDTRREYVIEFSASGLGLSGSLPDNTIGKLKKLRSLDLSGNNITSLPSDFWSLSLLKSLNLSSNLISGSLTSNLDNFVLLETLDLSFNSFSGEIPAAISSLIDLTVLKLNNNGFESVVPPEIFNCQSLVVIDLSSNRLSGPLPIDFGSSFPLLKSLNLSGNLFQGSLMGSLHGDMDVIDLSKNQFHGHISELMNHNWSNLIHLDLSQNHFIGHISDGLSSAKKLRHLNLACNRFRAQEFPNISMLSALHHLNLSETNLVGSIPDEIRRLIHLEVLDLSSNHLTGNVPSLSLENSKILDLSHNELEGDIPEDVLEKLPVMQRFNFSYNNLTFCTANVSQETIRSCFFGSTNNCPIAADPVTMKRSATHRNGLKIALALSVSIAFMLIGALLLVLGLSRHRKSKTWATKQASNEEEPSLSQPLPFQTESNSARISVVMFNKPMLHITFPDLLSATSNFDKSSLLSQGKFGCSYRAVLPGGVNAALKVLPQGSTKTDQEAINVFERLGQIKHPNLVPLYGYCIVGEQRIAIYEFLEMCNLQSLLHELKNWGGAGTCGNSVENLVRGGLMTWRLRHKIALGTARALAFLHHGCIPPIVHGDMNARTIWLDANLQEPRLSDFGVAKLLDDSEGYTPLPEEEGQRREHVSLTEKYDVYCFGVVMLEIMSGKKAKGDEGDDDDGMVRWVREVVREGEGWRAIDPKMRDMGPMEEMKEAVKIGYLCTAELPWKRPTMHQVVGLLKDISPHP